MGSHWPRPYWNGQITRCIKCPSNAAQYFWEGPKGWRLHLLPPLWLRNQDQWPIPLVSHHVKGHSFEDGVLTNTSTRACWSEPGRFGGSSGGGVFNNNGNLIGINFAGASDGSGSWHINIDAVKLHLQQAQQLMSKLASLQRELKMADNEDISYASAVRSDNYNLADSWQNKAEQRRQSLLEKAKAAVPEGWFTVCPNFDIRQLLRAPCPVGVKRLGIATLLHMVPY